MFFKKPKNKIVEEIDFDRLPKHIGIIMDGNGRWAKRRGLPRSAGHKAGSETVKKIVREAARLGVRHMTVYAFSTENWKRPEQEVGTLMNLLLNYLRDAEKIMQGDNIQLRMIGSMDGLPKEIQAEINRVTELTKNNDGLIWNIALNYGGREEITHAARDIARMAKSGEVEVDDIDEKMFESHLYTAGQPEVDLLIRTSGEQRLSNFMLWQVSYAEFWYTNKHWPDFAEADLRQAIIDFQHRGRRFGGVKNA